MIESPKIDKSDPAYQYFSEVLSEIQNTEKRVIASYNESTMKVSQVAEFLSNYIQIQNRKNKIDSVLLSTFKFLLGSLFVIAIIFGIGMFLGLPFPKISKSEMRFNSSNIEKVYEKNEKIVIRFKN